MTTRRNFLKASAAAGAALSLSVAESAYAAGTDTIRVGVIGCGGRGSGAAENALEGSKGVKIVAIGDAFAKRTKDLAAKLARNKNFKDRVDLPPERCFAGLDAYQKVIDAGIDLVILATPPGFRPLHLEAAVKAGKHIFTEKPVAVDGPGIRKVLAAYEEAKTKNLGIVAGTQRRHQTGYLETMKRIHDGAIGDIAAARAYWNGGGIWFRKRDELKQFSEAPTDVAYQLHNWYHFLWVCGDHIAEQHVHNLDVVNWAMREHPVRCWAMGSRAHRPEGDPNEVGNIYDNFAVEYEYRNGARMHSYCRHFAGPGNVSEALVGTKGTCLTDDGKIYQINGKEVFSASADNKPYVVEHTNLVASIREGKPLNELKNVAESTLTAIMGRMAAYTGRPISWKDALESKDDTFPKNLTWDTKIQVPPVPVPGKTKFV